MCYARLWGTILGSKAIFIDKVYSCIDVEELALQMAMNWASELKIQECSFETDSAACSIRTQEYSSWSLTQNKWLAECADILNRNDRWVLKVIRREANRVADVLANKAVKERWKWISEHSIPICLYHWF